MPLGPRVTPCVVARPVGRLYIILMCFYSGVPCNGLITSLRAQMLLGKTCNHDVIACFSSSPDTGLKAVDCPDGGLKAVDGKLSNRMYVLAGNVNL